MHISAIAVGLLMIAQTALAGNRWRRGPVRVRRELRSLSEQELDDLFDAIWTMKKVENRSQGLAKFGYDYQPYEYFNIKHAVAVVDDRGDQAHFSAGFMTFHRAFMMEFEAALLSVLRTLNSTLDALPYWDPTLDADTGRLFKDPDKWIFSPHYLGGYTGNASEGYAVTDGRAAWWPIRRFEDALEQVPTEWRASVTSQYQGNPSGLMRSPSNPLSVPYSTRMPKIASPLWGGFRDIVYTEADAALCMNAKVIRDWMEWQDCIENARVRGRESDPSKLRFWNLANGLHFMHSQFHFKIGGYLGELPKNFPFSNPNETFTQGDFMDVGTSPNDVFFAFHHANVDRLNMAWQRNAMARDPSLPARHWGFPHDHTSFAKESLHKEPELRALYMWRGAKNGTGLHSVMNSRFPFTRLEGLEPNPQGHTHAEVLAVTGPGVARYTYDTFQASSAALII